jgi:hypothetical protein
MSLTVLRALSGRLTIRIEAPGIDSKHAAILRWLMEWGAVPSKLCCGTSIELGILARSVVLGAWVRKSRRFVVAKLWM